MLAAEPHKRATGQHQSLAILATEVGDGLEVGAQLAQQPQQLDIALGFALELARGAHLIEVAIQVQLEQIGRIIGRAPGVLGLSPGKAQPPDLNAIDPQVDDAHQMIVSDQLIERHRKQAALRS